MTESVRQRFMRWRMEELLLKYSGLRLAPTSGPFVKLAGYLSFCAEAPRKERIDDEYEIEILVPFRFPEEVPSVREIARRIPASYHKLSDGSLCLGSPTRLRLMVLGSPWINSFVELCVIPYLYGYSYFEKHSKSPFGELDHGEDGIRQDLASLYGVEGRDVVPQLVRLTSMKRRIANKRICPCGSSQRLGRCHNRRVNSLRNRLGRRWFQLLLLDMRSERVH